MIELDKIRLEPAEFGSQGNAVLGIRDSGKTYTATKLAEELFDAGIPFVAFDPIGVWRYLRVPGKGKGYPVVVAGGEEGDVPLTPASAPMIVEAAMQSGVSVVIDLFDMKLSKADWRRIVRDCIRLLLHKNKAHGLRHIFLEEAAEFAPQKIIDFDVYAEIEKLARMGGNSRLGYTLINQRAQEVNKAVLELCENLFLHRQKGVNALANVKRWLDVAGADGNAVMRSLATLPSGECWAWLSGSDVPVHVKVPEKKSLHPDRRVMHGDVAAIAAKKVNVGNFVSKLMKALPALEEEKNANDPVALRAEIKRLIGERDRALKGSAPPYPDLREAYAGANDMVAQLKRSLVDEQKRSAALERKIDAAAKALGVAVPAAAPAGAIDPEKEKLARHLETTRGLRAAPAPDAAPSAPPRAATNGSGNGSLPPGERAVLIAAVQYGEVDRDQLSVLTGYKTSSRNAYILRLSQKGLITVMGQKIAPADGAREALGDDYQPLPTGADLQDYWRGKLPAGEAAVLNALIENYPTGLERTEIDEITGYKVSSRNAYILRLKARRLVEIVGSVVKAAETLF